MKERKKELRNWIARQKTQYSDSTLKELSADILAELERTPAFDRAQTVLLYHSLKDEVYTHTFIEKWSQRKRIVLPVVVGNDLVLRIYTDPKDLVIGSYGIAEPIGQQFTEYESIDLAIIPGVAFDVNGHRLGRGKGYYDRLLPQIHGTKIGICFPFQLIDEVPSEAFDIPMNAVISR